MTHSAVHPWIKYTNNPDRTFINKKALVFQNDKLFYRSQTSDCTNISLFLACETSQRFFYSNKRQNNCPKALEIQGKLRVTIYHLTLPLMVIYWQVHLTASETHRQTDINRKQSQLFQVWDTWPYVSTWLERFSDTNVAGVIFSFCFSFK